MRFYHALAALILLTRTPAAAVVFDDPVRFPGPPGANGTVADPRLAAAGSTALIVWTESTTEVAAPSTLHFARSGDFGRTWSPSAPLRVPEVLGLFPDLAGDGAGNWLVAWIDGTIRVSRSSDDGLTWGEPLDVGLTASDVEVAAAAPGAWLLAAIRGVPSAVGSDTLVVVSRSNDGGQSWQEAVELARATNAPAPRPSYRGPLAISLASRGDVAVLAWADVVLLGGVNPSYGTTVAFRSGGCGSSWTRLALPVIDGLAPTVAADGAGGWSIATKYGGFVPSSPGGGQVPQMQSAYSTDDGETWQAASPVDDRVFYTPPPGPGLTAAGVDTWVAAWATFTTESSGLAVAHRCSGPSWSAVQRFSEALSDIQVVGMDDEIIVVGAAAYPFEIVAMRGDTSAYCTGCDDGDACTIDVGDAEVGCVNTPTSMGPGAQGAAETARVGCAGEGSARTAIKRLRRAARAALRAETHRKRKNAIVQHAEARTRRAARRVAALRQRLSPECVTALDAAVAACTAALECAGR